MPRVGQSSSIMPVQRMVSIGWWIGFIYDEKKAGEGRAV